MKLKGEMMPIDNNTTQGSTSQSQLQSWEIEGLNDEEIVAELLDERVELAIAAAPPYDCGCDMRCQVFGGD